MNISIPHVLESQMVMRQVALHTEVRRSRNEANFTLCSHLTDINYQSDQCHNGGIPAAPRLPIEWQLLPNSSIPAIWYMLWHAIKKLQPIIPDSRGQVSSNKLSYRV